MNVAKNSDHPTSTRLFSIATSRVELSWSRASDDPIAALGVRSAPPGRLVVRARRADAKLDVWRAEVPNGAAREPDLIAGPRLFEETDYRLVVRSLDARTVAVRHRDPVIERRLESEDRGRIVLGQVNFRSQVGLSEFHVLVDGEPEFDFEVEVFPTKLDYATDYEQLLADVQESITGLAVEYLRSTFRMGRQSWTPQPTHVEWLALLAHVVGDLERAAAEIARHPSRTTVRTGAFVRVERIRRVDASIRSAVRRRAGSGETVDLEGLPVRARLQERRAHFTLDTPEHRFLARQIERIGRRLAGLRREEAGKPVRARRERVLDELKHFGTRVQRLGRLEPFAEARGAPPSGFASLRLLASPGYREAYRACLILSLGLRIDGGPVRLSVKEISLLYEYWTYLALVRLVGEELGQSVPVRDLFKTTERGLQVTLARGRETSLAFAAHDRRTVTVRYNPLFSGDPVLIPQRPDVVVTLADPEWPKLHLILDAKYRVDATVEYLERYLAPGPPEDALNVLHRYRDAILELDRTTAAVTARPERSVVLAAAAFPYRDAEENGFRRSRLWRAHDRIGVGAVPALPGDVDYLREWLRSSLARGGWALADRAIDHRLRERAAAMRVAAAEPAAVVVLRGVNPGEHFAWIASERIYYTPLAKTQPLQFAARWVAVYSPSGSNRPGAVVHAARVESVDVVARRTIPTPWPSGRDGDELQVLYRLGPVERLAHPIRNTSAARPPVLRWTTKLALDRARTWEELALETEREWRLYEELTARGIEFRVETAPRRRNAPFDGAGRAVFALASGGRIRIDRAEYAFEDADGRSHRYALFDDLLAAASAN